jgi:cell division protein FtsI (penicillin-binding protein 3)
VSTSAPRRTIDRIDRRVGLMFGVFLLLLLIGVLRAAYLGTIRSSALRHAAYSQQVENVVVPAPRGEITDRNGVIYAISAPSDTIDIDPKVVNETYADPQIVANKLAPLIGLSAARTLSMITKRGSQYVQLAANVPAATAARITKIQVTSRDAPGVNGIWEVPTERRVYPRGNELSQVLGWVGSGGGIDGLESMFNKSLAGTNGKRKTVIDAQGKAISVDNSETMVPGKSMKLTISAPLQAEVESVLAGVGKQYDPVGATAIVTDPQTDQILALANWPSLNLDKVPANALTSVDGHAPAAEDQAVDFSYEPGSTFKAVTVAGALEDRVVTPNTSIYVPSSLDPYGRRIEDAEVHPNEYLTVRDILKVSSNIGADEIAARMGPISFAHWVSTFGFGKATGVDLPGEQTGVVLPESQYSGISMYNLPFGQGEEVTPMQMVQAYDAIANGGILRTPQIVESVGGTRESEPKGKRIISPTVAAELRDMLRGVLADGGTASGAVIPGYDMAGKTGTAQVVVNGKYSNRLYNGSFIGMVPASDPKLVVAVLLSGVNNGFGGTVAAPAFQKIVGWAVPHFGINPCPPASAGKCSDTATPSTP